MSYAHAVPPKTTGPMSLRDRQKAQTREHLLDVAAGLFAEKTYSDTTIEDIAKAAGASRATVYSYFSTKEDILRTLAAGIWDNAGNRFRAFAELPEWSRETVRAWLEDYVASWDRTVPRVRYVVESMSRELRDDYLRYHRASVRLLTADPERWLPYSPAEAEVRSLLLIAQMETFFANWYIRGWKLDRATVLDTLADVWCSVLPVGRATRET
jgi:AcrR family transcriptional regulator